MEVSISKSLSISTPYLDFFNGLEIELMNFCVSSLSPIPKVVIYKITMKVGQGASTFWMFSPLEG